MPSPSDSMLDSGCVTHLHQAVHGVKVLILSGIDAGKSFQAVVEIESDFVLNTEIGEDRRSKRIVRFQESAGVPKLTSQDQISIDGKKWNAVRNPGDSYLTADFELKEIALVDA